MCVIRTQELSPILAVCTLSGNVRSLLFQAFLQWHASKAATPTIPVLTPKGLVKEVILEAL